MLSTSVTEPGATNIEPDWTLEAAADPRRIVWDSDPKSRSGAIRIIGYSPSAGFVITVIATPSDHAGATAWKSSGADLRDYIRTGRAMRDDARVEAEVRAIREEYADEEAEAAEVEAAENAAALDVPLSLRITKDLDRELRRRAAAEQIPTSALVRRLLSQVTQSRNEPVLTVEQVEQIARRVAEETINRS